MHRRGAGRVTCDDRGRLVLESGRGFDEGFMGQLITVRGRFS